MLTNEDLQNYQENGYLIKRSMYSTPEIEQLFDVAKRDNVIRTHTYGRKDRDGNTTRLALWYTLEENIYSAFVRSARMVQSVELLLEGRACHFHTKLMQKEPHVGGAWEWHQDYGYWYHDGFLFPYMMSAMIALTPANKANGCLQVLKGSHLIGRIEHGMAGDQKGADMTIVEEACRRMELAYVELEPGDTLFFHGNLLHRSDKNSSDSPRWSMITAFNRVDNKPYKTHEPSCYTPIEMLPDENILSFGTKSISESSHFNK